MIQIIKQHWEMVHPDNKKEGQKNSKKRRRDFRELKIAAAKHKEYGKWKENVLI